ncbi:hypothetical protein BN2475_380157 [Paraburkholderia ribeironis]|uniref:Glycosyltransferase 2-like domain-containing protein n=1 Tax=Paraburkholderia ribeironis TaxID=1247936 RepID=A0A1N7S6F6_9BURK|nr:hypothetical protein [Paraburkholderia ribeironis]SIT42909.1 hypothetical protein BN2475_380157 [Paraburkholderia ribeironis]
MRSEISRNEVDWSSGNGTAMPVHYVIVIYYAEYLAKIAKVAGALMNTQRVRTLRVVVNNPAIDDRVVKQHFADLAVPAYVLRHNNTGLEFGAYQFGLDDLRRTDADDLPCLFANDTVGTHYPINRIYLREFSRAAQAHLGSNAIVGLIDSAPRRLELYGQQASRWVRSNLFVMDKHALESINNQIYVAPLDSFINESPREDDFFSASIGPSLRSHISHWLFSGSSDTWYKSEPLSLDNHLRMARKARSILQELFLSMRLEGAETALVQPQLSKVERVLVNLGCAAV